MKKINDCQKIKIYPDSGANIIYLKRHYGICEFVQRPYDSADRPKNKKMGLAPPSALTWENAHTIWNEEGFSWNEYEGSDIFSKIEEIVGKHNKADVLHLDSAYKDECHIFLTADKGDIWNNRFKLEQVCEFKIFYPPYEQQEIINYIVKLKHQLGL